MTMDRLRISGFAAVIAGGLGHGAVAADLSKFDGIYKGEMTLTQAIQGRGKCTSGFTRTVAIKGGSFKFTYNTTLGGVVVGTVSDTGLVSGTAHEAGAEVFIKAQIDGNTLRGEGGSGFCHYSFEMKR